MILIDHDVELTFRRMLRTETSWPDESDIFARTRADLRAAFEGTYVRTEGWRDG